MTKKRFTHINEDIFQYGEWYCSAKSEHCADVIATALNELIEDNEQLKKELEDAKLDVKIYKNANTTFGNVYDENEQLKDSLLSTSKELQYGVKKVQKLAKENEQLKIQLQNTSDQRDEFHRGARENANRIGKLEKENEQLKQQIQEVKTDEKQLSISFMGYKMQLIEVLQQNYNYAYNQRQKNLDKSIVARTYEVLAQTVYHIAETMNVDIERFPKYEEDDGDVE